MASSNTRVRMHAATHTARTHNGLPVEPGKPIDQLRRTVMGCLLFEGSFYENGQSVANRIADLAAQVSIVDVLNLAAEARRDQYLRHAPLWLLVAALNHPTRQPLHNDMIVATIVAVCDRPDQMGELLAQYMLGGKKPLANALRTGLATAFNNFNDYQLAKYAQKGAYRLRDVMFLVHPKPTGDDATIKAKTEAWKLLANDKLKSHDTWEDQLSAGGDKKEVFTDLITRGKLGGLALIRNLRNMEAAGVDKKLVKDRLNDIATTSRLLPFQFLAAARACPKWEDILEAPMIASTTYMSKLPGKTVLLIDHSGSMQGRLSAKSDLHRIDAARALAVLAREICEEVVIAAYNTQITILPPRRGFGLVDAIPAPRDGTDTGTAVNWANTLEPDRVIVFTDEQSSTRIAAPYKAGYLMNVASYQNGIGWGKWITIDGFSEHLVKFMHAIESSKQV